jgi:hypothetical protein
MGVEDLAAGRHEDLVVRAVGLHPSGDPGAVRWGQQRKDPVAIERDERDA